MPTAPLHKMASSKGMAPTTNHRIAGRQDYLHSQSQDSVRSPTNAVVTCSSHIKTRHQSSQNTEINVLQLEQCYNTDKAMTKKSLACSRPTTIEDKGGNLLLSLDTFTFELFRDQLLSLIHIPRSGSSRQANYTKVQDGEGKIVQDIIQVKNWSVLGRLAPGSSGNCSLTLNLYRTTSKIMVNGPDYKKLLLPMQRMVSKVATNIDTSAANKNLKAAMQGTIEARKAPAQKEGSNGKPIRKGTKHKKNNKWSAELADLGSLVYHDNTDVGTDTLHIDSPELAIRDEAHETEVCPLCNTHVNEEGTLCETCDHWHHYNCLGLDADEINRLESTNSPFVCPNCASLIASTEEIISSNEPKSTGDRDKSECDGSPVDDQALAPSATPPPSTRSTRDPAPCEGPSPKPNVPPPPSSRLSHQLCVQADSSAMEPRLMLPGTMQRNTTISQTATPNPKNRNNADETRKGQDLALTLPPHNNSDTTEISQQQIDSEMKKLRAKERQLRQREKAIEMREDEVHNITQQATFLKTTINQLEMRINDLEQQNRELRLRLLAWGNSTKTPETSSSQPTASPSSGTDVLMATLTTLIVSLIDRRKDEGTSGYGSCCCRCKCKVPRRQEETSTRHRATIHTDEPYEYDYPKYRDHEVGPNSRWSYYLSQDPPPRRSDHHEGATWREGYNNCYRPSTGATSRRADSRQTHHYRHPNHTARERARSTARRFNYAYERAREGSRHEQLLDQRTRQDDDQHTGKRRRDTQGHLGQDNDCPTHYSNPWVPVRAVAAGLTGEEPRPRPEDEGPQPSLLREDGTEELVPEVPKVPQSKGLPDATPNVTVAELPDAHLDGRTDITPDAESDKPKEKTARATHSMKDQPAPEHSLITSFLAKRLPQLPPDKSK